MFPIPYRRHRFPPAVIQHAVWLYLRFTLSYRDVEELLCTALSRLGILNQDRLYRPTENQVFPKLPTRWFPVMVV
jgi:hypothetical protein